MEPELIERPRARAVFSTEDFTLMKKAVMHFLQTEKDDPDTVKLSALYHRLGRLG